MRNPHAGFRIVLEAKDSAGPGGMRCTGCPHNEPVVLCVWTEQTRWWHEYPFALCEPCLERYSSDGFVYFIRAGDVVKIGHSVNPQKRLKQLATGSAVPLELWHRIPGSPEVERSLHREFAEERLHGEWFQVSDRLREYVEGSRIQCTA